VYCTLSAPIGSDEAIVADRARAKAAAEAAGKATWKSLLEDLGEGTVEVLFFFMVIPMEIRMPSLRPGGGPPVA
jgi:hypothetical protein